MVLQKFQMCDPSHQKQFQFCCIKDNRIFCSKCWYKTQHFRLCQSTRCGDYQKLAHLVINRALQLKNIYYLQNMSSKYQNFQTARIKFLQLNYKITEIIKQWIQQKIPLFLWTMMNDMLNSKFSQFSGINCNKYDGMCTQMLKTIKNTDPSKKPQFLQMTINNFNTIHHQLQGCINSSKSQPKKDIKGSSDQKVQEVLDYSLKNFGNLLMNIKSSLKDYMTSQISNFLKKFDQNLNYKGVSFPKVINEIGLFKKKQCYQQMNINTQLFNSSIKSAQTDIYNGFSLNIINNSIQTTPEQQLLQLGKSFIKQKLFTIHQSIDTFKSSYPYKYTYPIATCIKPDQQYQQLVIQLDRAYIKSLSDTKSKYPFLNSLSIIIIGPEVIVIRFVNKPDFGYTMKIFNYKKARDPFYKKVKQIMGLTDYKERSLPENQRHIIFTQNLSLLQLAYCNFRIAYEQIFIIENQQKIFEGQKISANRGFTLMNEVIQKWKNIAKIQLNFSIADEEVKQIIV